MDDSELKVVLNVAFKLKNSFKFEEALELYTLANKYRNGNYIQSQLQELNALINNDNDRKLSFVVAGTQKGGTTALDKFMRKHKQICMPRFRKELHYFDADSIDTSYTNYHKCFFPDGDAKVIGEITPIYMFRPGVLEQLHLYNKNLKLVFSLRDPIERAYSQWNMLRDKSSSNDRFDLNRQLKEYSEKGDFDRGHTIKRGMYYSQISTAVRIFGKENIHIIVSEDLRESYLSVLQGLSEFLGISNFDVADNIIAHKREYESAISKDDYLKLKDNFLPDATRLSDDFGVDISKWFTRY
jgi:hypothetical protein